MFNLNFGFVITDLENDESVGSLHSQSSVLILDVFVNLDTTADHISSY